MISTKSIIAVVMAAILIGVLYVFFDNNFLTNKNSVKTSASSSQISGQKEAASQAPANSIIALPTPEPELSPIDSSSDLVSETSNLEMRDYSPFFEELKGSVSK